MSKGHDERTTNTKSTKSVTIDSINIVNKNLIDSSELQTSNKYQISITDNSKKIKQDEEPTSSTKVSSIVNERYIAIFHKKQPKRFGKNYKHLR